MTAKNILCGLGNDEFGFQDFSLKYMLKISRVNICNKQVIFNNVRQFLSVENYYSLISNQPPHCQLGMLSLDKMLSPCLIYLKCIVVFHGRWEVFFQNFMSSEAHVMLCKAVRYADHSGAPADSSRFSGDNSSHLLMVLEKEDYLIFLFSIYTVKPTFLSVETSLLISMRIFSL